MALLLGRNPGSVYATNNKGRTALECAARKKKVDYAMLEVLKRVRAATAPLAQKTPAPTQVAMELMFPPAIMRVASVSSITSVLHQKRMLCCDCPMYHQSAAVVDHKNDSVAMRDHHNTIQANTMINTIRASKSTLKTANMFATSIEVTPLTAVLPHTQPPTRNTLATVNIYAIRIEQSPSP